ncbi:MAG: heavy metal translocating P-type ATPase [Proteobacteria bacterium]|nr:heavy metal translocating P-type ATPase [Pseudomonadota bacterium]
MLRARRLLLGFVLIALAAGAVAGVTAHPALSRWTWDAAAALVAVVVARDLIAALRRGVLGVDVIALLAILGALALGQSLVGAIIALMVAGGAALEEFAAARARGALTALLARAPRIAHRQDGTGRDDGGQNGGGLSDIPVADIRPGDRLLVRAGEVVPVDGTLAGPATLDTAALTGEPLPVAAAAGAPVESGVINAGAPFTLAATATAEASTYAAVVRLVAAAERERPPLVRLADRWAAGFLALTLALAAGAWAVSGEAVRALAVLVVATPCPLILAAPVALIGGISRAAARGIVVKGGGALERLARARIGLFDKTGTLTSGTPRLVGVEALDGYDPDTVLRVAATLEQASGHGVAAAIVAAARGLDLPLGTPEEVAEIPGGGLSGTVEGIRVLVGSAGLLAAAGLVPPPPDAANGGAAARLAAAAAAAAWVALDGQIVGVLLLADPVRADAAGALRSLRAAGISRLVMVSGDREAAAARVGAALGLDAVHGGLSPGGKIAAVTAERARGPVLMVGDGINDAPALAAADIGIAMGARGAAAAAEAAEVVITVDRLDRVAEAVAIARRARTIALESIVAGMALSGIAMLAAAAGALPPVAGALLQEAIDVAVILNALRVLRGGIARPLADRAAVARLDTEHVALRDLLERMRHTATALDRTPVPPLDALRRIAASFQALLLPHQAAEEAGLYPALARALGGRDPLGTMTRMHAEIARAAERFTALVAGMDARAGKDASGGMDAGARMDAGADTAAEAREAQRLLHTLDALLELHLAAEEALLATAEEPPARRAARPRSAATPGTAHGG